MSIEIYLMDFYGEKQRTDNNFVRTYCPSPSCNYDGNSSRQLWINIESGYFGCWRCEKGGKGLVSLIAHLEQISWKQAKKKAELYDSLYSGNPEQEFENLLKIDPIHPPENSSEARGGTFFPESIQTIRENNKALNYLFKRGFSRQQIEGWNLHYCKSGKYQFRIMMPVYDVEGKQIRAWQGRDITGRSRLPYLSTSEKETGVNIKHLLLNIHRAVDPLVVVEGWMDVIAVGREHGVCLLGKGITDEQIVLLRAKKPKKVIVPLDGDAVLEADSIASTLRCFTNAQFVQLPYGEDPASLGQRKFWDYLGLV